MFGVKWNSGRQLCVIPALSRIETDCVVSADVNVRSFRTGLDGRLALVMMAGM